jgi:uncharacterized membrane protein
MAKKNKYDTDPLDPSVADRADQAWGPEPAQVQPQPQPSPVVPSARPFVETEEPTRRLDKKGYTAYHSVFDAPADAPVQPVVSSKTAPPKKHVDPPTSRPVAGLNLAENATLILPYVPFYIGAIVAVIELFMIPRSETRARFHASQGLAMHAVALIIGAVLGALNNFAGARIGGIAFSIATTILFVVSMIRVWRGEPVHIAPLDDLSTWLNDKIAPKKR